MVIYKEFGCRYRITLNGMDLDDYIAKFCEEVARAREDSIQHLSNEISNNLQV